MTPLHPPAPTTGAVAAGPAGDVRDDARADARPEAGPRTSRDRADAVLNGLRGLIPSEFPALVFTSLAAVSVPTFSDRCRVFVDEDDAAPYRIERPFAADPNPGERSTPDRDGRHKPRSEWSGQWVSDHSVQTSFAVAPTAAWGGFRGTVLHQWNNGYRPTGTDVALARQLVDHAVAVLRREQQGLVV